MQKDSLNYEYLFRHVPGQCLVLDSHFLIIEANDSYLGQTSTTREDILNKNVFDVFFKKGFNETADVLRSSLEQVLKTKTTQTMPVVRYDINQRECYWKSVNTPILNSSGAIDMIIHSVVDVTESELEKSQLNERIRNGELLRVITDHIPTFIGYMDTQGRYLFVNKAYQDFFKMSAEEIVGRTRREFTSDYTADTSQEFQDRALKGESVVYENIIENVAGDRADVQVHYITDRHPVTGTIRGAITLAHDVTKLKKAVQLRDDFLSIASHELKTPLTAIQLQMQMTQRQLEKGKLDQLTPERMRMLFETSNRNIQKLSRLIDDMLDISRISSGKLSLRFEPFELSDLVKEVVHATSQSMPPQMKVPEVVVECNHLISVVLDRFRIEQVIINLLTNAFRYGESRPVTLKVWEEGAYCYVEIKDQGIGIEPENLERIFQRFERAVDPNFVSGLGLGLYICREIVQLHHGELRVVSQQNYGSTFTIKLPKTPRDR